MEFNDTTPVPLPEVKIGEREILANLIHPAAEDNGPSAEGPTGT